MKLITLFNVEKNYYKKINAIYALVTVAVFFIISSILIFSELVQHQKMIMASVEEDAFWASYQLDKEIIKFDHSVEKLSNDFNDANLENMRFRFEILYSRLDILKEGKLNVLFNRSSEGIETLRKIREKFHFIDDSIYSNFVQSNIDNVNFEVDEVKNIIESFILDTLSVRAKQKEKNRNGSFEMFFSLTVFISMLTINVFIMIYILFRQFSILKYSNEKYKKLSKDLKRAIWESEKSLKIKSEFISTMSHEIRTPMNAIIGLSYLLIEDELDEKKKKKIKKIKKSADNLLSIINGILDFSKIESGKIEIEETKYSLDAVLDYVYDTNYQSANKGNINFCVVRDFNIHDELIGDEFKLQQILINIVSNAIKFTYQGKVELEVSLTEENLEEKMLLFTIKDTGVGIDGNVDVFDVFQQADSSTTRLYGGTGLGLSITQKLARLLGGEVHYQSQINEGSEFFVTLPYQPDLKTDPLSTPDLLYIDEDNKIKDIFKNFNVSSKSIGLMNDRGTMRNLILFDPYWAVENSDRFNEEKIRLNKERFLSYGKKSNTEFDKISLLTPSNVIKVMNDGKELSLPPEIENETNEEPKIETDNIAINKLGRVLLAEDNATNANIITAIIERVGLTVDWVVNGKDAYEKTLSNFYDLILMDIRMPVMDGYEASRKIHENLRGKRPPIVILTADVFSVKEDGFSDMFFDEVILKPFEPSYFMKKVKEIIFSTVSERIDHGHIDILFDIEKIERTLEEGGTESKEVVSDIVKDFFKETYVSELESIEMDALNKDYTSALVKFKKIKFCLYHDIKRK